MRVLFLVLGCAAKADRIQAVLDTWGRELPLGDELVVLGDAPLAQQHGSDRVWECVEAGGPDDTYKGLPKKVLAGLRRARARPGWDVVAKLDDDTLAVPARVHAVLEQHVDPAKPLYFGGTGYRDNTGRRWISHHGLPQTSFFYFAGGGAYFLTRPALEQAWEPLEKLMSVHGVEDGYLGAALHQARVPVLSRPDFFRHFREPERVLYGCAATICELAPGDLRLFHRLVCDARPLPFTVVDAEVGWGSPGLNGMLGYQELEVRVSGVRHTQALSAHAPSRVLLRGAPGHALRLRGAINDPAGVVRTAKATFAIDSAAGEPLVQLGEARVGEPTGRVAVSFPSDGRLLLRVDTADRARCHSVWLWEESA